MADVANRFSAAGAAVGYVAQVEYALLQTLERITSNDEFVVSLETLDDIVFEYSDDVTPLELLQSKHHYEGAAKNLTDKSEDLWKTLHNWLEVNHQTAHHYLLTTNATKTGSVADRLTQDSLSRDVRGAEAALRQIAMAGGNAAHSEYYKEYLARDQLAVLDLLNRVYIVAAAPTAPEFEQAFLRAVRISAPEHRRAPLVERLRGWWIGRSLVSLSAVAEGRADPISVSEVEDKLHQINSSLRDDNLPLDYEDLREPTQGEADADSRMFVEQLRLISWHSERIRMAIYDHNRAFTQRSRWQREHLVGIDELGKYDRRLTQEWKRHFLPTTDAAENDSDEEAMKSAARDKLLKLEATTSLPEVRSALQSGYIPLGSMHMLADQLQIGWHPEWVERLRASVEAATGSESETGAA